MKQFQITESTVDSVESCLKKFAFDIIDADLRTAIKTSICNHLLGIFINMENVQVICDESNNPCEVVEEGNVIYKIIETHPETGETHIFERFI